MSMTADDIVSQVPEQRRCARQLTRDNNAADHPRRRPKWPSCSFVEQAHGAGRFRKPEQIDRPILKELRVAIEPAELGGLPERAASAP